MANAANAINKNELQTAILFYFHFLQSNQQCCTAGAGSQDVPAPYKHLMYNYWNVVMRYILRDDGGATWHFTIGTTVCQSQSHWTNGTKCRATKCHFPFVFKCKIYLFSIVHYFVIKAFGSQQWTPSDVSVGLFANKCNEEMEHWRETIFYLHIISLCNPRTGCQVSHATHLNGLATSWLIFKWGR